MPGLRACFQFAHDRYTAFKRERDALDFDDLEAGALALLETNAAVRARWQAETAALLVDEFQDTNDRQRRLVRCLERRCRQALHRRRRQAIHLRLPRRRCDRVSGRAGGHCPGRGRGRGPGHLLPRPSGTDRGPERPPPAGAGRDGRPGAALGRAIRAAAPLPRRRPGPASPRPTSSSTWRWAARARMAWSVRPTRWRHGWRSWSKVAAMCRLRPTASSAR